MTEQSRLSVCQLSTVQADEKVPLKSLEGAMNPWKSIGCVTTGEGHDFFVDKVKIIQAIQAKECSVISVKGPLPEALQEHLRGKEDSLIWLRKKDATKTAVPEFPWFFLAPEDTLVFVEICMELEVSEEGISAFLLVGRQRELLAGPLTKMKGLPDAPACEIRFTLGGLRKSSEGKKKAAASAEAETGRMVADDDEENEEDDDGSLGEESDGGRLLELDGKNRKLYKDWPDSMKRTALAIFDKVKTRKAIKGKADGAWSGYAQVVAELRAKDPDVWGRVRSSHIRSWNWAREKSLKEKAANDAEPEKAPVSLKRGRRFCLDPGFVHGELKTEVFRLIEGKPGMIVARNIRKVVLKILAKNEQYRHVLPENGGVFMVSLAWVKRIMRLWGLRESKETVVDKTLPDDWVVNNNVLVLRLAYLVARADSTVEGLGPSYEVPKELVISMDEMLLELFAGKTIAWPRKGLKNVALLGADDKNYITLVTAMNALGEPAGLQLIYKGKSYHSLPPVELRACSEREGVHFTFSADQTSNLATLQEYFHLVLDPYFQKKKKELNLRAEFPCIVVMDCYPSHTSEEFRDYIRSYMPWVILVYSPPKQNIASLPACRYLPRLIREVARDLAALFVCNQLKDKWEKEESELQGDKLLVDVRAGTIKPLSPAWMLAIWKKVFEKNRDILAESWGSYQEGIGMLSAWDARMQLEAADKKSEVFPPVFGPWKDVEVRAKDYVPSQDPEKAFEGDDSLPQMVIEDPRTYVASSGIELPPIEAVFQKGSIMTEEEMESVNVAVDNIRSRERDEAEKKDHKKTKNPRSLGSSRLPSGREREAMGYGDRRV